MEIAKVSQSKSENEYYQQFGLVKYAANASIATAIFLIIAKLIAWVSTGSVSVLATLIDSLFDAFTSLINRVAIHISSKPADENHHFGHHKAEELAILAQAAFISGSAIFLIIHAVGDLRTGSILHNETIAFVIMGISIFCTFLLVTFQNYVIKKTHSEAIRADSLHYKMDLLTNSSVIIALILSRFGYERADAIFGILIALYMLYGVTGLVSRSIQTLMDQALPPEALEAIQATVLEVNGVTSVHNLRTRGHSSKQTILFDLDIDGTLSLSKAHEIGANAKQAVLALYPSADIFVHLDPYG